MDVPKPYKFTWFGDVLGPKPYDSTGVSRDDYFAHTGKIQSAVGDPLQPRMDSIASDKEIDLDGNSHYRDLGGAYLCIPSCTTIWVPEGNLARFVGVRF